MFEYFVYVSFFLFLNIVWHIVGIYVFETVKFSHTFFWLMLLAWWHLQHEWGTDTACINFNLSLASWVRLTIGNPIFPTCQRSCRKVIILVVCICLSQMGEEVRVQGLVPNMFKLVQLEPQQYMDPSPHPCSLWSANCWQAYSWHSTKMPSCLNDSCRVQICYTFIFYLLW